MTQVICTNCQKIYPESGTPYICGYCGGVFDFKEPGIFPVEHESPENLGIWKYKNALNLPENAPVITLGEGNTPLVPVDHFDAQVYFKLEYLNPTGSFKDRGTAVLISFLCSRDVREAVEDSSGNAGASFAAYAARADIRARVYIPEYASGPKRAQIEAYGADVIRVPGSRSNTNEMVIRAADAGQVYASHAFLPFGMAGLATIAYELVEQLGGSPGTIVTPVGQGTLLQGLDYGFRSLQASGRVVKMPVLIGIQASVCAPLWAAYTTGRMDDSRVTEGQTIAEGVRVNHPIRAERLLKVVERSGGRFYAVDEIEIVDGWKKIAQAGFYVEPTSAIVYPVLGEIAREYPSPVVVILTGFGLKSGYKPSDFN